MKDCLGGKYDSTKVSRGEQVVLWINYLFGELQESYRQWVCSTMVPHWTASGHRLKPCKALCHRVEQTCPFFLPGDRAPAHPTQYAGEPTFLCLDPNIPETGGQVTHSLHGPPDCCYMPCQGADCPPAPSEAACARTGTAHHLPSPPLETCDTALNQPPSPPSGNPCVLAAAATTSRSSRTRSRPRLAIILFLLHVAKWHATTIQRTLFMTPK